MQIKSVARKDLIPFAEKVFCIYKLSAEQIRCCLKGCAFLCRYMESYNVCEYVPQIGEQCINNLYEQSVNKYRCRQVIPAIQALNAYIVNIKNKHHGAHALRHSLATLLLEEQVKLPVISEVLGHENTESTSYYLRIDIQSLKKCSLDVSPVCENFYTQKGGYFYE